MIENVQIPYLKAVSLMFSVSKLFFKLFELLSQRTFLLIGRSNQGALRLSYRCFCLQLAGLRSELVRKRPSCTVLLSAHESAKWTPRQRWD